MIRGRKCFEIANEDNNNTNEHRNHRTKTTLQSNKGVLFYILYFYILFFDQLNNRLISAVFPRWNLEFALVLFGFQGLLLVGVLWFIMQQSRR